MKKDKLFIRTAMTIIGMIILGIGVFLTIKVNLDLILQVQFSLECPNI
ncbi:hypothetical protein ACP4DD_00860 [Parvimonas sp. G1425]